MERNSSLTDKISLIAFLASIAAIGFGYGFLSHRESIFPQSLIEEAIVAAKALLAVRAEDQSAGTQDDARPVDPQLTSGPNTYALGAAVDADRDSLVLITGGPYQHVDQCPNYGCLAWLIDRDGTIVHRWEVDLDTLWADTDHVSGVPSPRDFKALNVRLEDDGSIIASFQAWPEHPYGAGLAKFDLDGNIIWSKKDNSHHWFTMDEDGMIYVSNHISVKTPIQLDPTKLKIRCENIEALVDFIRVVDGRDGTTVQDIPLFDIMLENGFAGLIEQTSEPCDPLHLNFVEYVDQAMAAGIDGVEAGDLLISMRNINSIALLDPRRREIKWISSGLSSGQHSPRLMPDGSIIVFDNVGGDRRFGGSRISRLRIHEIGVETLFPVAPLPGDRRFFSKFGGYIDIDASGKRALVSLTQDGDLFEIDLESRELLWHYEKIFPAENYTRDEEPPGSLVRAEIWGAFYVDRSDFVTLLAAKSKE